MRLDIGSIICYIDCVMTFSTYQIEITKSPNPKSGYRTKYGNLNPRDAAFYWASLNIGNGYKARLRSNATGDIIARKA